MKLRHSVFPTIAAWLLVWAASLALTGIFDIEWQQTSLWPFSLGLTALMVAGARLITQKSRLQLVVPPLVGLLAVTWFLLTLVGSSEFTTSPFPQPGSFGRLALLANQAIARFEYGVPPLGVNPPVVFAVTALGLVLFLMVDLLAHSKVPSLAAIPPLFFWVPASGLGLRIPTASLLGTVGAIILLFAVTHQSTTVGIRVRYSWRPVVVGVAVAAVGVASTIGANAVAGGVLDSHRLFARLDGDSLGIDGAGDGLGVTGEFSTTLALDQPLPERSTDPLFTYLTSNGRSIGPFRFRTYSRFDGQQWSSFAGEYEPHSGSTNLYWNQSDPVDEELISAVFTISNMTGHKIPITGSELVVNVPGAWSFDSVNDVAKTVVPLTPGNQVATLNPSHTFTTAQLRQITADDLVEPGASGSLFLAQQLQVPDDAKAQLVELAYGVAAESPTVFDAAVALQNYLREYGGFSYSFDPPLGSNSNMVLNFLENRTGFCVHFASTMVLLSRSLGIPARLAVGYLPGTQLEAGQWAVSPADSHSWAELYFGPQIGWVAFEPTPAAISGAAPSYTLTGVAASTGFQYRDDWDDPGALVSEAPDGESLGLGPAFDLGLESGVDDADEVVDSGIPPLNVLAGGSAVLSILGLTWWLLWRRRSRSRHAGGTPASTTVASAEDYALHRATNLLAKRGLDIDPGCTPRQFPQAAATSWLAKHQNPAPPELLDHLTTLANAAEQRRYASNGNSLSDDHIKYLLRQVKRTSKVKR